MVRSQLAKRHHDHMEVLTPHEEQDVSFLSRTPRAVENIDVFLLPFSTLIWSTIMFSLFCLSVLFMIIHKTYTSQEFKHLGLHNRENSYMNFFLYTFCKLTEPDPVPWFTTKWSAGKFLTFMWSMYCLLIVSFYNCNLRAHLSAVNYEKPIETAEDVLLNGQRPWLLSEHPQNQ